MDYNVVIGLEIHTQLATQSKLFCGCSTAFGQPPNANTCPVCLGLPGALPVLNKKAVELAVRLGHAINCTVNLQSQFARKNYFYPDLPKSYQISQFDHPLGEKGWIEIDAASGDIQRRINITRIHMEEDAGKLVHEGRDSASSYVDLNRAGVPLVEIVSEPELFSPQEARAYMEKMHQIVRHLGISNADMEKGNFRADVNVSLQKKGSTQLGTRTETKNINSFRFVQFAIEYEIERQRELLERGEKIVQETRLYDPVGKMTYSMRSKEEAHDYRYFPEPDLPILKLDDSWVAHIHQQMDELPQQQQQRLAESYQLNPKEAAVLVNAPGLVVFFEATVSHCQLPRRAFNWVTGDMLALINKNKLNIDELKFNAQHVAKLIKLVEDGAVSGRQAKEVFENMFYSGSEPEAIIEELGLKQITDSDALSDMIKAILSENQAQVKQYHDGKSNLFGFFMGQVMKQSQGQANPQEVNKILRQYLEQAK